MKPNDSLKTEVSMRSDREKLVLAIEAMQIASARLYKIGVVCGDHDSPAGHDAADVGYDLDEALKAIGPLEEVSND